MSTLLSAKIQFFRPFSPKKQGSRPAAGKKPDKIPGKSRTKSREKARKDRPEAQKNSLAGARERLVRMKGLEPP